MKCKLCGQSLGSFQDYDEVLRHAYLYHTEVFMSFFSELGIVRDLVLDGDINGLLEKEDTDEVSTE